MKKVLALVLAVVLCMGLGAVAFAAAGDPTTDGSKKIVITVRAEKTAETSPGADDATYYEADDLKASIDWNDGKEYFKSVELDDVAATQASAATATKYVTKAAVVASTDTTASTYAGVALVHAADKTTAAAQFTAWKTAFEGANSGWEASFDATSEKITITAASGNEGNKTLAAADNDNKLYKTAGKDAVAAAPAAVKVTVKFNDYYGTDDLDIDFDLNLKKGSSKKPLYGAAASGCDAVVTGVDGETSINVTWTFGWGTADVDGDNDDAVITVGDGTVVFGGDDAAAITFATFEFDASDAISVAGKMSKQDEVNMNLDVAVNDEIKALMKKNEDIDFDVLNFTGKPEFDFTQEVTYVLEDEDKEYFVYEIKDGKAVKVNAKLNDDKDALVWKTRVLGAYIVTDAEIKAVTADEEKPAEDGDKENPETGASDFVGVAVALGAVSLVAAGAAALKK